MTYYCPTCKEEIPDEQVEDEEFTDDGHLVYDYRHPVEGEMVDGRWRQRYHGVECRTVSELADREGRRELEVDREVDARREMAREMMEDWRKYR